ncbi:MAG: transposase [Candidatus Omnitrophica bacterium]|nr:transposase [Candidatus Omnitrophota bacterium]
MPIRKVPLITGEVYHIYNKSIADFTIFHTDIDYERMKEAMSYYAIKNPPVKLSLYKRLKHAKSNRDNRIVDIIAYCLMPTHIHVILKETEKGGIEHFTGSISQSYSQYFNIKHRRKGPLWESRFGNVLIKNDEQLSHLTSYIHLNPVTAYIVNNPADWKYSSYGEYMGSIKECDRICCFSHLLTIDPFSYRKFVTEQIERQREIAEGKRLGEQKP